MIRPKTKRCPSRYREHAAAELGREDYLRGIRECPRYYCSKTSLYEAWKLGQAIEEERAMRNP